jgi:hypothetical protein
MTTVFRLAHFTLLGVALIAGVPAALAQSTYPTRTIQMIVPLAAASAVDNAARLLAQRMSQSMGQSIVVENQPGAAGLIGAERVAKAAPDGYTIGGFNDSIMTMLPNLHATMPWDILKDFEPISLVATVEWGLVVNNDAPYKTAADLIAAAKANPGRINYGSGGNGSPQHVAMELFATSAGISLTHVPYRGATQAAPASVPRRPDDVRVGAARFRVQFVVCADGPCPYAEADRRASERRGPEGTRRSRASRAIECAGADGPRLVARRARNRNACAARKICAGDEGSKHQERMKLRP